MVAADFVHPTGELTQLLFPGEDLTVLVNAWLTDANGRVASITDTARRDDATRAWVYHRGYTAVANRVTGTPNEERSFDAQRGWTDNKGVEWRKLAEEKLLLFNALATEVAPPVSLTDITSGYARVVSVW